MSNYKKGAVRARSLSLVPEPAEDSAMNVEFRFVKDEDRVWFSYQDLTKQIENGALTVAHLSRIVSGMTRCDRLDVVSRDFEGAMR